MSNYRIERLIGIGGEAVVYEARPLQPDGDGPAVACKVMREAAQGVAGARALTWQAAALGLRITPGHPNLVQVLDCFEDTADRLCIMMELVDGGSLRGLRASRSRLPFPIIRRVLEEVLEALAYLHGLDVLHRDLSPCNILISTGGSVKVADLGIAKVMERGRAHTRTYRGKLVYGSPEAIQTLTLDVRSDLYTLGAVLYELLTGTPPCGENESLASIVMRALREDFAPLPPDTPPDLAALAMGLLRTERDARRPQSATEALALLRAHAEPVASASELAAMVTAMTSQPGAEPDGAHRESLLVPGELLAPGHVLVARAALQPGASMAAAQIPALPRPPELAQPPAQLPAPPARLTAAFTGSEPGSASRSGARLGGAWSDRRHSHGRHARPVRRRGHARVRPAGPAGLASPAGRSAVLRTVRTALLGVCVLVSGILLQDRPWRPWRAIDASDASDAQRPATAAPALEPTRVTVPTPTPPASRTTERAPVARDPARPRRDRDRKARISATPLRERSHPVRVEPADLRWEPAVLGSALPPWATP